MKILVLFPFLVCLGVCERIRYDWCEVWEVSAASDRQLQMLHQLYTLHDNTEDRSIMFWSEPVRVGGKTELLVCPDGKAEALQLMTSSGLSYIVKTTDVQKGLDKIFERDVSVFAYDENDYNTYEDIYSQLDVFTQQCHVNFVCEVLTIGTTYGGHEIRTFHIHRQGHVRPGVWLDSLIHAREWLTGATVMGILQRLVQLYDMDSDVTYLLDTYDWYVTPIMNPDGYVYSWTTDRFWRKNLTPNVNSSCLGTDLNRNYDYHWGDDDSSGDPCSNTYRGSGPASELETQTVQNMTTGIADNLVLWLTYHMYGEVYIFPYVYRVAGQPCVRSSDYADLFAVGNTTVMAITYTFNQTVWVTGDGCDLGTVASGTTQDWAKGTGVVKYVYSPELRGEGFEVPAIAIPLSEVENWKGLVAMIHEMEIIGR